MTIRIIDDSDGPPGFTMGPGWSPYVADYWHLRTLFYGTAPITASWHFTGLAPGHYRVKISYLGGNSAAVPYEVRDGSTLLGTVVVNETANPPGFLYTDPSPDPFFALGDFPIVSGSLSVTLNAPAGTAGQIIADAASAEQLDAIAVAPSTGTVARPIRMIPLRRHRAR